MSGKREITVDDIRPGVRVRIGCGTVFVMEDVRDGMVRCHREGGRMGSFRDPIDDAVAFLNEEDGEIIEQ